jgi:ribosomal protein S18 acetylase RimI-like enzyme
MTDVALRPGGADDLAMLLALFDEAVAWLAAAGRAGQWGSRPWSSEPLRVARVRGLLSGGELTVAEVGALPAGGLVLAGRPPPYAPPVQEPELYVTLLIVSRRFAGRGVGAALLDAARAEVRRRGAALLRVDCWAGGDGRLVAYYRDAGFTATDRFAVDGWPGQVLEWRP